MTEHRINITQGEYATSDNENVVITTLLGSCVSCCLWDPIAGVGGMNHMLLARGDSGDEMNNLAGVNAMEVVINELIKLGACLLYTSPSPRDRQKSRMPSSA